jgi:hypothetical protein
VLVGIILPAFGPPVPSSASHGQAYSGSLEVTSMKSLQLQEVVIAGGKIFGAIGRQVRVLDAAEDQVHHSGEFHKKLHHSSGVDKQRLMWDADYENRQIFFLIMGALLFLKTITPGLCITKMDTAVYKTGLESMKMIKRHNTYRVDQV